jgi:hypothetical protein
MISNSSSLLEMTTIGAFFGIGVGLPGLFLLRAALGVPEGATAIGLSDTMVG